MHKKKLVTLLFTRNHIILFIAVLGFILRVFAGTNTTVSRDGIQYTQFSMGWHNEEVLSKWHVNDTILFIYIMKKILIYEANPVLVGLSLNIVLGTFFIVLTFLFVERMTCNSIASLLCSFLVAIHPTFILLSADILRENLFLCLSALSLIYVFSHKTNNSLQLSYIIAALFSSCAILTRAEGLLLLPFIVASIWIKHRFSFAMLNMSIYLLLSSAFYFIIIQILAPEHRVNILERTLNFIF